jgi:hypothetical protein
MVAMTKNGGSRSKVFETAVMWYSCMACKTAAWVLHYQNKIVSLFPTGDEKQVGILIQLVRDQPTS